MNSIINKKNYHIVITKYTNQLKKKYLGLTVRVINIYKKDFIISK